MEIISGNRGSGRTTELVKRSSETGFQIVVSNWATKNRCLEIARELKLNIPEPVVVSETTHDKISTKKIIVDDSEQVLGNVLESYVVAMSVNKENIIDFRNPVEKTNGDLTDMLYARYERCIRGNDYGTGLNILKNIEYLKSLKEDK